MKMIQLLSVKRLAFFGLLGLLLLTKTTQGQGIKSFTSDSVKYLAEVTKMFFDADKKKYKPFVDEFTAVWYSGKFSEKQRSNVYNMSNAMLKRRMRVGEFSPYLSSLVSFINSGIAESSFDSWQLSLEQLIEEKKKSRFTDYLKLSENLFRDNTLYSSASTTWRASNRNYQFVYDGEPKIVFEELNLKSYAKRDSSVIYNTSGVYYPNSGIWEGDGGKVTWERVGLPPNGTYAVFDNYSIKLKSPGFNIDSVKFFNAFFDQPLDGELTEKILAKTGEKAGYPRFESYEKRLSIPNIVDGADYDGGFSMYGNRLLGSGTKEEPARLIFYREEQPFLVTEALNYTFNPDRVSSSNAAIVFYIDEDSIFHPAVNIKFVKKDRLLTLLRDPELSKSPFFNSFHSIDMYFEALYWKIDDPLMEMGDLFGSTQKKARFESINYYQEELYESKLRYDAVHPLIRLKDVTKKVDSREFTLMDLAIEMKLATTEVLPLAIELASEGFITFDTESEIIVVKDKTFEYILARAGKVDYDIITVQSDLSEEKTNKSNAVLNLLNYDLLIRGVQRVNLSDSQQVAVFPADEVITMKKNRDFTFLGALVAGKTTFYGKEFGFLYDEFKMDLINVDSMSLRATVGEDLDYKGRHRLRKVTSVIEGIRGHLDIDNPFNKSGIQNEEYPQYPVLTTSRKAYVFYDDPKIYGGVYSRDNFYFQIEPFVFDSLDNHPNSSIEFAGTFVSGGIFPNFEEELTLQEDYSLGFIRNTPTDGFDIYGTKSEYNKEIRLDSKGLTGEGEIEFLSSTTVSDAFTFFPDSTSGIANFTNVETEGKPIGFPEVKGEAVKILYIPKKEALVAKKVATEFDFFNGEAKLDGTLVLKPNGMVGLGSMNLNNVANLKSNLFVYDAHVIDADTADFKLISETASEGLALKTDNVNAHVDFEERKGVFKSNDDESFVEFPVNQYICYMDKFNWYMDQGQIELESTSGSAAADIEIDTELDLAKSNFYSVHKDQDSLNFISRKAKYDLKTHVIKCNEVPYTCS